MKKLEKIFIAIVGAALVTIVVYAFGAFITWEIWPQSYEDQQFNLKVYRAIFGGFLIYFLFKIDW